MGLYLCIFDQDDEVDGVEIGSYSDFNGLREFINKEIEKGAFGAKFPTFLIHSDSDGEWTVLDCKKLRVELSEIILKMKELKPVPFITDLQKSVASSIGLLPENAYESFIDVDGEFVLGRIYNLVELALQRQLPILFQ